MFDDGSGNFVRGLVTLPLPGRRSRAVFRPSGSHWGVVGTPELIKVRRAAILALREFATHPAPVKGGQIEITRDFPLGVGMGSSTSDVTATIRAVADYHGVVLSREEVGRLAVLAEVASDSIMIDDRVVLFAQREGKVLETLGHRLPPVIVIGCDAEPGRVVDTLSLRQADYTDAEIGGFRVMRGAIRRAVATEDVALLGHVATASARINQRFLPKQALEPLLELCVRHGGSGVQVAHSGTVAGLIFDARMPGIDASVQHCLAGIDDLGLKLTAVIGARPSADRGAALPSAGTAARAQPTQAPQATQGTQASSMAAAR